jgi:hypothetical protein
MDWASFVKNIKKCMSFILVRSLFTLLRSALLSISGAGFVQSIPAEPLPVYVCHPQNDYQLAVYTSQNVMNGNASRENLLAPNGLFENPCHTSDTPGGTVTSIQSEPFTNSTWLDSMLNFDEGTF